MNNSKNRRSSDCPQNKSLWGRNSSVFRCIPCTVGNTSANTLKRIQEDEEEMRIAEQHLWWALTEETLKQLGTVVPWQRCDGWPGQPGQTQPLCSSCSLQQRPVAPQASCWPQAPQPPSTTLVSSPSVCRDTSWMSRPSEAVCCEGPRRARHPSGLCPGRRALAAGRRSLALHFNAASILRDLPSPFPAHADTSSLNLRLASPQDTHG